MTIGIKKSSNFFLQRNKLKGSITFLSGIILVLIKWPIFGILLEFYGMFVLFGYIIFYYLFIFVFSGFIPVALSFVHKIPIIGPMLLYLSSLLVLNIIILFYF